MRIGIIGLGLIGASLAKAIKRVHASNSYIIGYDTNLSSTNAAYKEGVIDRVASSIGESFSSCTVIFLCTPVHYTSSIVEQLLPFMANDCILTDMGSTKYELVYAVDKLIKSSNKRVYFVGGHPMAGSEKSGYSSSTPYLFENAYYILTPISDTPDFIIFILQKMVERIGAIPLILSPTYHDYATANVSHLPHIIASSLVQLIKQNDGDNKYLHTLAAGGFKDITRIASSNPDIWVAICLSNKKQLQKVFSKYHSILLGFFDALEQEDTEKIYNFFDNARSYRNTFSDNISGGLVKTFTLYVDAKDEPGILAAITTLLSANKINIKNIGVMNHREFESGVIRIVLEDKTTMLNASEILVKHGYSIYY